MALYSSSPFAVLRRVLGGSSSSSSRVQRAFVFTASSDDPATIGPPLTTPKLFISGLSRLTTDEKLKAAFSPFGKILEANVVTDRVTGRSKGFAFIKYATIDQAEKAREGMHAKYLDGWVIFVDPAKPREPRPRPPPEQDQSESGFRTNKTIGWCG